MNNSHFKSRKLRISHLWLAGLLALFFSGFAARATVILDLPELILQPNQANQVFTFSVQNTGTSVLFNGVQLELIVGDGDAVSPINGSGGGPAFQAVTLIAPGLLFNPNNNGDRGAGNYAADFPPDGLKQLFQRSTSTSAGSVTLDNGIFDLATVTFDTTGVDPGNYSWAATWSIPGFGTATSYFTDGSGQVFPTLIDGTLTVVPEPVNVALPIFGGLVVLSCGLRRWYRQRVSGIGPQA